ncbi:RING finger protein 32 [Anguilla rostrata]|uniref:RING finger protein 32 n=1 Tax=Anguilla rostrata TaxID=7938 RepID=UPI0030D46A27
MQCARSKGSDSKFAITAVALQDHISRSLQLHSLSLCDPLSEGYKSSQRKQRPRKPAANNVVRHQSHHWNHGPEEKEYVLDPSPPPMTLAQKLGLADAPPAPLTADEWSRVKSRSVDEGDSSQPCVICREEFRLQPQVLLSCSHVFHRVCLQAFEKFSGRKCCPMCRKEQYQTRVIHDGAHLYREKCAVRIQACWRGYVVREWYRQVRKTVPPKDKGLRRKFFERKFQELSDSFVRSCDTNVEEFLSAIDCELASSRSVFRQLEEQHISETKQEDWEKIQEKAARQEARDCPICLTPLCAGTRGAEEGRRRVLLLSCSHLFHLCCLEAFESFCLEGPPVCPLCRSLYRKRLV